MHERPDTAPLLPGSPRAAGFGGVLDAEAVTRFANEAIRSDRLRGRRTGLVAIRLGHPVPPDVAATVAERLLGSAREQDAVGWIESDRLVLVTPGLREVDALAQLIVRVRNCFAAPILVAGVAHDCPLEISGSLANDRSSAHSLLRAA